MSRNHVHICFVAPNAFPMLIGDRELKFAGGAELQQVLVARELVGAGYKVSMICLDFGQPDKLDVDGVTVYRTCRAKAGVPVLRFLWPRLTSLWSAMSRANADVYYQRTASMLTGVVAAFCKRHGRRSIFSVAGETKIRFRRDRMLFEYGLRRVDRIIAQNFSQQEGIKRIFGRESIVIPNIYPLPTADSEKSDGNVLWVGMIRNVKRPDIFLDIVESLPEIRFTMIGGESIGESGLYQAIARRAAQLENLEFLGFVPYHETDRHFDKAVLLLNTSDSEGFPNTFLQAWSRGIPTLSFVDCGARIDGKAVGIQAESPAHMSAEVEELVGDEAKRHTAGERAKLYVRRTHAPEVVLRMYDELFRGVT